MDAHEPKAAPGDPARPTPVDTGGGAYVGGSVSTGGGSFVGRDQITNISIEHTQKEEQFRAIEQAIEARPNTDPQDKADLHAAVKDIRAEAAKGSQADAGFIERHLRNMGRIAPDILEVAVATFANPGVGLALVAKKIADKAQSPDAK